MLVSPPVPVADPRLAEGLWTADDYLRRNASPPQCDAISPKTT
jgi:hypothetical protein